MENVKAWDCNKRPQTSSSSSPQLPLFTCSRTHANTFNDLSHPVSPPFLGSHLDTPNPRHPPSALRHTDKCNVYVTQKREEEKNTHLVYKKYILLRRSIV